MVVLDVNEIVTNKRMNVHNAPVSSRHKVALNNSFGTNFFVGLRRGQRVLVHLGLKWTLLASDRQTGTRMCALTEKLVKETVLRQREFEWRTVCVRNCSIWICFVQPCHQLLPLAHAVAL